MNLSQDSKITVGLVIVLVGCVVWLTTIASLAGSAHEKVEKLEGMPVAMASLQVEVSIMREQNKRIEEKLDFLIKKQR